MSSPSNSNLPPLRDSGVFSVSSSVVINAPREKVWSILLDFPSYHEWNPVARGQTIVDASKKPLSDQSPAAGKYLYISPIHIPPSMSDTVRSSSAFEIITEVDHENYRCAWKNIDAPRWILNAERWQLLSIVEGEPVKTKYETFEVFGGLAAYVVRFFLKSGLEEGFRAMADSLKKRAED